MRSHAVRITLIALALVTLINAGHDCAGQPIWPDVEGFRAFQADVVKVYSESSEVEFVSIDGRTALINMHDRGWLATNYHVIRGASRVEVDINGKGQTIEQCVVVDRSRDLAILPCPAAQEKLYPPLRIARRLPNVGGDVWAIGYPGGLPNSSPGNVGNVLKTKQFPADFRAFLQEKRAIPFSDDTQWIQVQKDRERGGSPFCRLAG